MASEEKRIKFNTHLNTTKSILDRLKRINTNNNIDLNENKSNKEEPIEEASIKKEEIDDSLHLTTET